jgi:hypothetical protein
MSRQFITLRTANSNETVDLEVPGNEPIGKLIPDILKALNWPAASSSLAYNLHNEAGVLISETVTFQDAGVDNFDTLWIQYEERVDDASPRDGKLHADPLASFPPELEKTGSLPAPQFNFLPLGKPCLVSSEGYIFVLGEKSMVVGRRSSQGKPEIDLLELDSGLISSRRHAEVIYAAGRHILRAFDTRNGTLLNGALIEPGDKHALTDGDVLQFGYRGVKLVFRQP